ncbi:MAG: adenylate/guanylate cyclase domain-containing protein, partial [Calditrichia bacterium]|nr:adenylate/guanylate cyclase domain-containing protein [Calditrichia bacterium]
LLFPSFSLKIAADSLNIQSYSLKDNKLFMLDSSQNIIRTIELSSTNHLPIYFNGTFKTFRYISFFDVMNKRIDPAYLKNKIVLIGTSLPGLYDLRSIPLQEAFPGVEMHANIIYNLLNNIQIQQLGSGGIFILLLTIGILFSILIIFIRPVKAVFVLLLILIIYSITSLVMFINQLYVIPDFVVIFNLLIILMVNYSYRYFTEEKNKKQIKNIFSHYVSKSVVDELLKDPSTLKLGGEKKNCSVLFSDIEGFTTISEKLPPEKLAHLLNEYHSEMTEMVFENNGFLDKYIGDAIMAVYGAPVSDEEHALNACKSALEMQHRLKFLEKKWEKEKKPVLKCRIGINSGEMIVGNMGSATMFDYTVMGDEVNLGARLEGANKAYGSKIMIGHNTYLKAKEKIIARKLDLLQVKGKSKPVPVYELLSLKTDEKPHFQKKVEFFENGLEEY